MGNPIGMTVFRKFPLDGIARAAGAVAGGVAGLHQAPRQNPVKPLAVVKSGIGQGHEIGYGIGGLLDVQFQANFPAVLQRNGSQGVRHVLIGIFLAAARGQKRQQNKRRHQRSFLHASGSSRISARFRWHISSTRAMYSSMFFTLGARSMRSSRS